MLFRNGINNYRLVPTADTQSTYPEGSQLDNYILYGLECRRDEDATIADCDFEPNVQWFNTPQCVSR